MTTTALLRHAAATLLALAIGCDNKTLTDVKKDSSEKSKTEAAAPAPAEPHDHTAPHDHAHDTAATPAPTPTSPPMAAPSAPGMPPMMPAAPLTPPTPPAPTTPTPFAAGDLIFTLPPGWQATPGSGMRFATLWAPNQTPFSVLRLGGDGGGMLMNINRWRGQLMLPPLTAADLPTATTTLAPATPTSPTITLADIKSQSSRILGAVIPTADATWFIKVQTDNPTQLDPVKEDFLSILKSAKRGN